MFWFRRDQMAELTYPEVGATDGALPSGYHHVRESRRLGHGRAVFEEASSTLLSWGMHEGAGVRKVAGPDRARAGADVTFSWHRLAFECRILAVVDDPDRKGFTYGTLTRHPECGEEQFMIMIDANTQLVDATITAFSKPANRLVWLAGPLARYAQRHMTRRYLDALTDFEES